MWQQARKRLDRFPCRTRKIDGHEYLNWEDYLGWRGRRVKGNIASGLSNGLVMSRWNRWVKEQGGEGKAALAGNRPPVLTGSRFTADPPD